MRVVINQLASLKRRAGVGHYAAELVHALRAAEDGDDVFTYPEGWVRRGCEKFFRGTAVSDRRREDDVPGWRDLARRSARALGRLVVGSHFRRFLRMQRIELYHEPNFVPLPCDQRTVVTLHDLSVLRHPEWHPRDRVCYHERHFLPRLEQCAQVITDTEAVRNEVIRWLGLASDRVSCARLGVRAHLRPALPCDVERLRQKLGLPRSYLLHVGTIEPRKNLGMLLRAYQNLPGGLRERCGLVLAGAWGWNTASLAESLRNEARACGVQHLGYVAEEDLPALYTGATALVFPTHYEGFGFPALEMMACGGAVLASNDPAVMEITARRALHLSAEDEDGWHSAMRRVIEEPEWRQMLRRGVREQAQRFTWERCAAETRLAYRRALGLEAPANDLTIWSEALAA